MRARTRKWEDLEKIGVIVVFPYRAESKDNKDKKLINEDLAILFKVINIGEHMKKTSKTIIHWKEERRRSIV